MVDKSNTAGRQCSVLGKSEGSLLLFFGFAGAKIPCSVLAALRLQRFGFVLLFLCFSVFGYAITCSVKGDIPPAACVAGAIPGSGRGTRFLGVSMICSVKGEVPPAAFVAVGHTWLWAGYPIQKWVRFLRKERFSAKRHFPLSHHIPTM